jgi:hypothetical protein
LQGHATVSVEKAGEGEKSFGKGKRMPMLFGDFLEALDSGEESLYMTTQDVSTLRNPELSSKKAEGGGGRFVQCLSSTKGIFDIAKGANSMLILFFYNTNASAVAIVPLLCLPIPP